MTGENSNAIDSLFDANGDLHIPEVHGDEHFRFDANGDLHIPTDLAEFYTRNAERSDDVAADFDPRTIADMSASSNGTPVEVVPDFELIAAFRKFRSAVGGVAVDASDGESH